MKDCRTFDNVSVHAIKSYVGVEIYFLSFGPSVLKESDWSALRPGCLTRRERVPGFRLIKD